MEHNTNCSIMAKDHITEKTYYFSIGCTRPINSAGRHGGAPVTRTTPAVSNLILKLDASSKSAPDFVRENLHVHAAPAAIRIRVGRALCKHIIRPANSPQRGETLLKKLAAFLYRTTLQYLDIHIQ